ncbi:DUF4249 domain-containing protein [Pontibacter pudoricolor]|uniref:DUF4249 domain-containing protein n=1 Tax=Pontibacter pudoricolor TaxID=2694930 RepID=UPI001391DF46|nr:DUF4249 domain-containing protein [Pontibacter pudoricolor]
MKKINTLLFVLLSAVVGLTGCESDVKDIDSFEGKSKLVVVSYISPQDTMLVVRVQKTQPAIGRKMTDEQLKVKDAIVTISNGASVIALNYNPEAMHYEADARAWPIEAGKTYSLKVTSLAGNAEATCTIPSTDGIEITEIKAPYTIEKDYYGRDMRWYTVSYKWRDAPDVTNFYRTLVYKQYTYTDPVTGAKHVQKEGLNWNSGDSKDIHTDKDTQNGLLTSQALSYYEYNYESIDKPFYIYAVLVVSDKNYYLYQQSLDNQGQNSGNPFAEPYVMYTNIEGGLGVFAGYNQLVSRIELN